MKMIQLGGSDVGLSVSVDARPAFEFIVSLAAYGAPDSWKTTEVGAGWFRKIDTAMPADVRQAVEKLGPRAGQMWLNLLPVAHEAASVHSASSLVAHLRSLSGVEIRRCFLGYYWPTRDLGVDREVIDAAAHGDRQAAEALVANRKYFSAEGDRLAPLLSLDPKATKAAVLSVVQGWHRTFFKDHERAVWAALQRDAAAKRRLLQTTSPERAIEIATGLIHQPTPGLLRMTLTPQFVYRPWNLFVQRGEFGVWCYPMADESLGQREGAPPRQLVRLLKAVADEKRLQILRALSEKDASLQDLTGALSMPKSTVHHHLLALRAAGLVRMTTGTDVRYMLRREALDEPSGLLRAYLQEPS
jgi:DNA-binding transcriptional ArsR family regulator